MPIVTWAPVGGSNLCNTVIAAISDEDIPLSIHGHNHSVCSIPNLPWSSELSPDLENPVVHGIGNVDGVVAIHSHAEADTESTRYDGLRVT